MTSWRCFLLSACCLAGLFSASAQSDLRPGYIIGLNGDTTSGWIAYKLSAGERCHFQPLPGGEMNIYGPDQLYGYGFTDDQFLQSMELPGETGKKFVQVLVNGHVSLLRYQDRFFLNRPELGIREIKKEQGVLSDTPEGVSIVADHRYMGVIQGYLKECTGLSREISRVEIREKPLVDLLESYYRCTGKPYYTYKTGKAWLAVRFGPALGARMAKTSFHGKFTGILIPMENWKYKWDFLPAAGIQVNISSPRSMERFHLHTGLWYISQKARGRGIEDDRFGTYLVYDQSMDLKLSFLQVPVGLRYSFGRSQTLFFVNGGFSSYFFLSQKGDIHTELTDYNQVVTSQNSEFLRISKFHPGLWAGGGVRIPVNQGMSLNLEARFERSTAIIFQINDAYTGGMISGQLVVGLQFE